MMVDMEGEKMSIEQRAHKKRRRRNLREGLLLAVGIAGILALGAAVPLFPGLARYPRLTPQCRYHARTVLGKLKRVGEIEFVERNGKKYARLTERGRAVFLFMKKKTKMLETRPKKWDGRYRLIVFDVPEKRKKTRERLRREMQEVGFLRVQDSVWLYPYDCEEFMALLKAHLRVGKNVLYAVVEEMEHDAWIRKHFNLL